MNRAVRKEYRSRLVLPEQGNNRATLNFYTHSGLLVARAYERVVVGDRGPYVEFTDDQIVKESLLVKPGEQWRFYGKSAHYEWWLSTDSTHVKFYHQRKTVEYADYLVGMWYAAPQLLTSDEYKPLIKPRDNGNLWLLRFKDS